MSQFNEVATPIINDPYAEPQQYYVIECGPSRGVAQGTAGPVAYPPVQ